MVETTRVTAFEVDHPRVYSVTVCVGGELFTKLTHVTLRDSEVDTLRAEIMAHTIEVTGSDDIEVVFHPWSRIVGYSYVYLSTGQRVEVHPAIDAWMNGDRYGRIVKIGRKYLHVKMDSGRTRLVLPENIHQVVPVRGGIV